jgi:hypothetical protein
MALDTDADGVDDVADVQISLGNDADCGIDVLGVHCWPGGQYGFKQVPPLIKPNQLISNGGATHCAVDINGAHCWYYPDFGYYGEKYLSYDLKDSVGVHDLVFFNQICAIQDNKIKCWNYYGQVLANNIFDSLSLINPRAMYVHRQTGTNHREYTFCAIDDVGLHCWEFDEYYSNWYFFPTNIPALTNPKSISIGYDHICALDANGVQCWGGDTSVTANVPPLINPVSVVSNGYHLACALDSVDVHCWGDGADQGNKPVLINPKRIFVSQWVNATYGRICAVDINGVHCWGEPYLQKSLPKLSMVDNCIQVPNADQRDTDHDALGDACDDDDDNDGVLDSMDAFALRPSEYKDSDNDGFGDNEDVDDDNDGLLDIWDPDPLDPTKNIYAGNLNSVDEDGDGVRDYASIFQVASGGEGICILDAKGLQCFDKSGESNWNTTHFLNPKSVAVGSEMCVLDDLGVHCSSSRDQDLPQLNHPVALYAELLWDYICAIDADGIKCWNHAGGAPRIFHTEKYKDQIPKSMTSGHARHNSYIDYVCALYDAGVECWEPWANQKVVFLNVPQLKHPVALAAQSDDRVCAIDDDGVKCWNIADGSLNNDKLPPLIKPTKITDGCALDASGLVCWDGTYVPNDLDGVADFSHPVPCALDKKGVRCWNASSGNPIYLKALDHQSIRTFDN